MIPQFRLFALPCVLALILSLPSAGRADDAVQAELIAIRKVLEQQAHQIQQLTDEVARLRQHLGGAAAPAPAPVTQAPAAAAEPGTNEFNAPVARAVAPSAMTVHIVVKGESLDSIAKLHKTTILELQRLNKITDPKKLQIGQALQLPPTP